MAGIGSDAVRWLIVVGAAAQLGHAVGHVEQGVRGAAAEEQNAARANQLDLTLEERLADRDLGGGRRAVAGRAPEDDVGDPDRAPVEPDRRQHPVEQLAAGADERLALPVLLGPGRLADQHQRRLGVAVGEAQPGRGLLERAAVEPLQRRFELGQRLAAGGDGPGMQRALAVTRRDAPDGSASRLEPAACGRGASGTLQPIGAGLGDAVEYTHPDIPIRPRRQRHGAGRSAHNQRSGAVRGCMGEDSRHSSAAATI